MIQWTLCSGVSSLSLSPFLRDLPWVSQRVWIPPTPQLFSFRLE